MNSLENCSIFSIDKTDLPANESGWGYRWCANNTLDESAVPLTDNYTINKGDPISSKMHVEINGTDNDTSLIYPNATNVTAWNTLTDNDCVYGFYRNDINLTSTFFEENLFGVGSYEYIYNVTNCTNYTDGSLSVESSIVSVTDVSCVWASTLFEGSASAALSSA